MEQAASDPTNWQLLSSHARVLLAVLDDDRALRSEIAARTEVTERTVSRIINDLEEAGYLVVDRTRRRNRYRLDSRAAVFASAAEVLSLGDRLRPAGTGPNASLSDPDAAASNGNAAASAASLGCTEPVTSASGSVS